MLTQKKTLTFQKENDNRWYLVCDEYKEEKTKEFRMAFTHEDKDGKPAKYEEKQDFRDPLDDHTKHPAWPEYEFCFHKKLMMNETFEALLEKFAAKGSNEVTLEVISYGYVANAFTHIHRLSIDDQGAEYEFRFRKDLPQRFRLTPFCCYLFDGLYPEHFHGRVIK